MKLLRNIIKKEKDEKLLMIFKWPYGLALGKVF
jgi:hypothetical protein